jgi:multidrug transporter EmrE-like cation transporter
MAFEVPPPEVLPEAATGPPRAGVLGSVILLLVSVGFAVVGQLTLKSAMDEIGRIGSAQVSAVGETLWRAAREPRLWAGLTLFAISAAFWLVVLSRVPLSFAYPFVGISYVAVVASSKFILHEEVPPLRWFGVLVVAMGIAIVGFSFRRSGT